jgi:competence protein ComEC
LIFLLAIPGGAVLSSLFRFFPYTATSIAVSACALLLLKRKSAPVFLLVFGILQAFFRFTPAGEQFIETGRYSIMGYFSGPEVRREGGYAQTFLVTRGLGDIRRLAVLSGEEFPIGQMRELAVRVRTPERRLNPGTGTLRRNPYAVLLSTRTVEPGQSVRSPMVVTNALRQRINRTFREHLSPHAASLVMAITTGQRGEMDPALRRKFRDAGLAHLLSISGTHFGLFGVLVFGLLKLGFLYLPRGALERLAVHLTPSEAAALLTLPFALFYLGISGASIPSVRAFVMIGLFLCGLLIGRGGHWLRFLLAAAVVLVLWDPQVVTSLSFQLSFIAVFFIGAIVKGLHSAPSPWAEAEEHGNRALQYGKKALWITLSASLGVLPLVAYHFHYVSVVSPFANFLVTPLVGFILVPLSLAGVFLYLVTGAYVMGPVLEPVARLVLWFVEGIGSFPHASLAVPQFPAVLLPMFYAGAFALLFFRRRWLILAPAVPVAIYGLSLLFSPRPLAVTFLDAGYADASVAELPDGKTVVIDTGKRGTEVARFLRYRGISDIDSLVLTHGHHDHSGGARHLLEQFSVKEVWDNGRLRYPEGYLPRGVQRRELRRGDVLESGVVSIQVLHPWSGFYTLRGREDTAMNNSSLVLRIAGKKRSFLLAGDVEGEAVEDMRHLGGRLESDVLKIPHHGKDPEPLRELTEVVTPQVAVASAGRLRAESRKHLEGTRVLVTGAEGAIRIEERGEKLRVKPYGEYILRETADFREELRNFRRLFTVW